MSEIHAGCGGSSVTQKIVDEKGVELTNISEIFSEVPEKFSK